MCYAMDTKPCRTLQYRRGHYVPLQISASQVANQGHRVASGIIHPIIPQNMLCKTPVMLPLFIPPRRHAKCEILPRLINTSSY